jgi:hypothetical protein
VRCPSARRHAARRPRARRPSAELGRQRAWVVRSAPRSLERPRPRVLAGCASTSQPIVPAGGRRGAGLPRHKRRHESWPATNLSRRHLPVRPAAPAPPLSARSQRSATERSARSQDRFTCCSAGLLFFRGVRQRDICTRVASNGSSSGASRHRQASVAGLLGGAQARASSPPHSTATQAGLRRKSTSVATTPPRPPTRWPPDAARGRWRRGQWHLFVSAPMQKAARRSGDASPRQSSARAMRTVVATA